jgi:cell wall assembly regulator SMI1
VRKDLIVGDPIWYSLLNDRATAVYGIVYRLEPNGTIHVRLRDTGQVVWFGHNETDRLHKVSASAREIVDQDLRNALDLASSAQSAEDLYKLRRVVVALVNELQERRCRGN